MEVWQRYFKHAALGSSSAFQKTFHNLTNDQLIQLRDKLESLFEKYAQPHEFAAAVALSNLIQKQTNGKSQLSPDRFMKLMTELSTSDISQNASLQIKIKQLLAIYLEIDFFNKQQLDWSQFSHAVQSCSGNLSQSALTLYHPHQSFHQLISSKVQEPIYSAYYCHEADQFAFCCKDFKVHLIGTAGQPGLTLSSHQSLPLFCCSFRPPVPELQGHQMRQLTGGYNYLTSGADRKLFIYNQSGTLISSLATENVHCTATVLDQVLYKNLIIQPAVFTGDDSGCVSFLRFDGESTTNPLDSSKNYETLGENELVDVNVEEFVDEVSTDEKNQVKAEDPLKRYEQFKKQSELVQKTMQASQVCKLSPGFTWSVPAHKGAVSCIMGAHMGNSDSYLIVSGGTDGSMYSYDIHTGKVACSYEKHTGAISGIAWLHQRGLLISVGKDRQLNIWSPGSQEIHGQVLQPVASLPLSDQPYIGVFSSPHKQEFLTVDSSGTVKQWDVRRLECVCQVVGNSQRNGKAVFAAFDHANGAVAVASNVCGLVKPQNSNQQLQVSQSAIQQFSATLLQPGFAIATNNTVQIWDLLRGKQMNISSACFALSKQKTNLGSLTGFIDNSDNVNTPKPDQFSSDKTGQVLLDPGLDLPEPVIEEQPQGQIIIEKEATALCLSPNAQLYGIATDDGRVGLYQVQSGTLYLEIQAKQVKDTKYEHVYKEMNHAKKIQDQIQKQLKYSTEDTQTQKNRYIKQNFGICTNIFFGPSPMTIWVCYRQSAIVNSFTIENNTLNLCGKYQYKQPWTGAQFLFNLNQCVIYSPQELNIVEKDGSVLCKIQFGVQTIKQVVTQEDILLVLTQSDQEGIIYVIDAFTTQLICSCCIPELQNLQNFAFSLQQNKLLMLDETQSLQCFEIQALDETIKYYQDNFVITNPSNIDLRVSLSITGENYAATYTTRRQYVSALEVQQEFRSRIPNYEQIQKKVTQNTIKYPIQLQYTQVTKYNKVNELNLQEMCLMKVYYVQTAQLFTVTTALGHILVISAKTGEFITLLSQAGWKSKTEIHDLINEARPSKYLDGIIKNQIEAETQTMNLIQNVCYQVVNGDSDQKLKQNSRERENSAQLAKQCKKEVSEYNQKHKEIDRSKSRVDISKAAEFIKNMTEDTERMYRAMSQTSSPLRKLPQITKKNARDILAQALVDSTQAMIKTKEKTLSPVRKQTVVFKQENHSEEDHYKKRYQLPSILTMSPQDITKNYKKDKIIVGKGTKEPSKIVWDLK
ncbi:Conserved_hypothetical protein [Hexamita inflata]|uniref:Uncharacterized protein n=1 Tax=Hexamita inflata TaxID=28002 RepID=A0AA86NEF1_9EUKA|nr:Conserved hypothetical protein [Hexamita inflata]